MPESWSRLVLLVVVGAVRDNMPQSASPFQVLFVSFSLTPLWPKQGLRMSSEPSGGAGHPTPPYPWWKGLPSYMAKGIRQKKVKDWGQCSYLPRTVCQNTIAFSKDDFRTISHRNPCTPNLITSNIYSSLSLGTTSSLFLYL